jgi:hypothetical protein
MEFEFSGPVFHWRGPAPHHFVTIPAAESAEIKAIAPHVTYGWGVIPVQVTLGATTWTTSLFPKDGRYLVPLRANVRRAEGVAEGDTVTLRVVVG